jgi:hypothetical protein
MIIFILLFSVTIITINFGIVADSPSPGSPRTDFAEGPLANDKPNDPGVEEITHPPLTKIEQIDQVNITGDVAKDTDDMDWFKIKLGTFYKGGIDQSDNLTLLQDSLSAETSGTGYIIVKIYGVFDINQNGNINYNNELILLSVERNEIGQTWYKQFGVAYTNPDDYYYICIESGFGVSAEKLTYRIAVEVNQVTPSLKEDFNKILKPDNDLAVANDLFLTMPETRSIDMDEDIFDWYIIETPVTDESIGTNFSIRIDIVNGSPDNLVNGIHYLTEVIVLIEYENDTDNWNGAILSGSLNTYTDPNGNPYLDPKIQYSEITNATTIHVGIYLTTYGIFTPDGDRYYNHNAYTHGWAQYVIKSYTGKTVIPPNIDNVGVVSVRTGNMYGRTYDVFKYHLTYYDRNNDLPTIMKVKINDEVTYDLVQSDLSDINLRDGAEFHFFMDGTFLYDMNGYDHSFIVNVQDSETWATGSYDDDGVVHEGPYITNNIPPYTRDTAPSRFYTYEDSPPRYQNLNKIFEDIDQNDELVYKIWDDTDNLWNDTFENEDLLAKVLDNDYLKIIPKPDQHGNVIVDLYASDLNHNVVTKTQLEITISSVNDPPEIKTPFDKLFFLGELHIPEDGGYVTFDMNDVFWDPIEKDPLKFTFSGNKEVKINVNESDIANVTIQANWSGIEKVTFSANDGQASISDMLVIVVDSKNDPPVINNTPNKRVYENQWCNFTIDAYDPDPNDVLTYSTNILDTITGLQSNQFYFDRNKGTVSFLTDYLTIGTYLIVISVTDSFGSSTTQYIEIEIMNIEDPPIPHIDKPDTFVFTRDYYIDFVGHADDPDLKIPNSDEILVFKWRSNIDGLFGEGTTVKDVLLSQGEHTITLEVQDKRYFRTATIKIKIVEDDTIDSDNDGIPDWWEERYDLDPRNPDDRDEDPDGDGDSNYDEYRGDTDPTDPLSNVGGKKFEKTDEGWDTELLIAIILIIVIIFIIGAAGFMYYRSLKRAEAETAEMMEKQKQAEADAAKQALEDEEDKRRGWGKYKPKFNEKEVLCCGCGTPQDVNSVVRPLALVCAQCGLKSVVYRR